MPKAVPASSPLEVAHQPSMWPAAALSLAAFLANFDVTAVIVALPAVADALGLGITGQAWMMDAYSLAFTGSLLIAGGWADRYGRRRAMLAGNLVFAAASAACAMAGDGLTLGLARALQGCGAAFVVTGGIALIAALYPRTESRTRAFSWLGVVSGVAMALGPSVGGVIADWMGWRWIFLANLPVCLLVAWSIPRLVADVRETAQRPLDYVGIALLTASLCVLVTALLQGQGASRMVAGLVPAALLFLAFVLQQQRQVAPILDAAIFLSPAMVAIALLLNGVSFGYWAVLVYLPNFLSTSFGWTSAECGVAMLAATLPMLFVPPLGARLVLMMGWRLHFTVALALVTVGNLIVVFALLMANAGRQAPLVLVALSVVGCGAALAHPQLSGAVIALAPSDRAGMASALTIVMRQAGFAIGIAVLGAVLHTSGESVEYTLMFLVAALVSAAAGASAFLLLPAGRAGAGGKPK